MIFRELFAAVLASSAAAAFAQTAAPPAKAAANSPQPVARQSYIATMDTEFRKIDADKDGKLTRNEIEGYQRAISILQTQRRNQAMFARLDADRNGQLSPQEFAAVNSGPPRINVAPVLAEVDLNKDGIVTQVEYRAGKLVKFDRMDTDKDSVISVPELRAGGVIK